MADILHVVDIHGSPEAVFEAVSSVGGIRRWWSDSVEGGDLVGDSVTVRFGEKWKVVMERTDVVPEKRVIYRIAQHDSDEWPGTELVFELFATDDWTTLKFDHRGWSSSSDFFRFCSAKWVVFLLSIKQVVESGVGTPFPHEIKIGRMG